MVTKKCKVCGVKTASALNINFTFVYVCDSCCNQIATQQLFFLIDVYKTKVAPISNIVNKKNK